MGVGEGYNPACTTVSLSVGLWLGVLKSLFVSMILSPAIVWWWTLSVSLLAKLHTVCGVKRICSFSFVFRSDVFIFLFGGKGRTCPHRLGKHFDFQDFSVEYFPPDWFIGSDRLGDSRGVENMVWIG